MNKLVITGATGFIGSAFVAELLKKGVSPKGLVLLQRKVPPPETTLIYERLKSEGLAHLAQGLEFVETDFSNCARLLQVLTRVSEEGSVTVVHLAAMIHAAADQRELQRRINVGVTEDLARFCEQFGFPFVYLSSVVAFGGTLWPTVRDENSFAKFFWINRLFSYYESKRDIHERLLSFEKLQGVLLCPSIVHGAFEDRKDSRGHIKALLAGRLTWAPPGGGNIVGLDRVVGALIQECERSHSTLETKLLVDENISFRDYFQKIVNLSFENPPKIRALHPLVALILFVGYLPLFFVWRPSFILGFFQGSLFLFFKSLHEQPPSKGAWENLAEAYRR